MYVFRDGRKNFTGRELLDRLAGALTHHGSGSSCDARLRVLIASGELECALRDAADQNSYWENSASAAEQITDLAAQMLVRGEDFRTSEAQSILGSIETPDKLSVSVLEGFAYYALHPQKFLDLLKNQSFSAQVAVIGIRSIGAPLSAVVARALDASSRITVRPNGHPYDRELKITRSLQSFLDVNAQNHFVIVDEGPGLSGSSFLAVAECLERCGIARERITMLGSRSPDPSQLRTGNAQERWSRFRFVATEQHPIVPRDAGESIGGGWWRRSFLAEFEDQPASWTQLEMAKYLSKDRRVFYKFEGFGHFGEEIGNRAEILHREGVGPRYLGNEHGFGAYELLKGRLLRVQDLSAEVLTIMARYCAIRASAMVTPSREQSKLSEMLAWNWKCEFGEELPPQRLEVNRLVTADGRMLPHEWMISDGRLFKLDGTTHGDDHFFPGPCDIAWDVAGAIVEWDMDRHAREVFVDTYTRESGDDIRPRLRAYLLAYATFRMGWSKMAAHASAGEFDQQLLHRDFTRYRAACRNLQEVAVAA